MTLTCDFISTFSIYFAYWKLIVKFANGDHVMAEKGRVVTKLFFSFNCGNF